MQGCFSPKVTIQERDRILKTALITGVTGQDGSYLAELLASKGYRVVGIIRGQNNPKIDWIQNLVPTLELKEADITDISSLIRVIEEVQPDEIYNLAAISFVGYSWGQASLTADVTAKGVLNLLEAIRAVFGKDLSNKRFYQASSSEMFGKVIETPQTETTRFWPRSPYGVAKVFGHNITVNYRESYGLFACSGILFNHESPRRDPKFVTRKISLGVSRIAHGSTEPIHLGNLEARRDWGFAGDYVVAMHQMLSAKEPRDLVIATGKTWSIEELLERAFSRAGITSWRKYVVEDPAFKRPAEVDLLLGDSTRAQEFLGWKPTVPFDDLVNMMVDSDLNNTV